MAARVRIARPAAPRCHAKDGAASTGDGPQAKTMSDFDLAIVGGGINGVGIARDAAGRGLRVLLVEQNDLASGTSSASSKLIHGGLRYLEHGWLPLGRGAP